MFDGAKIFETHYEDYCKKINRCDLDAAAKILKIDPEGDGVKIRFLDRIYRVSGKGIEDREGRRPGYGLCVVLAKYLILCPDRIHDDPQWVSFKDFKKDAGFTNVNFFTSDTEQAILKYFAGNVAGLTQACKTLGAVSHDIGVSYDVAMAFEVLPRISLLLLFNDRDEEFPAQCRVLFQKHAEFYLDPESLAMTSAGLAKRLVQSAEEECA